jgi:hypothetical protein
MGHRHDRVRTIVVSSWARDVDTYPSPAYYVVPLEDTLRDVVAIELVYALYDRVTGSDARFVSLMLREAASTDLICNCNTARHAFTQLPMTRSINEYTPQRSYRSRHTYAGAPLAKLDRLTVAFASPDGSGYPMRDHLLRFEVTTRCGGGLTQNERGD